MNNNNFSILRCEDCDYNIGDIGPAGGIIVATPWMNSGSVTPNGMATNHSQYYFELAPSSLGQLQWGNYTVFGYTPGYNNNPDEAQGQDNTGTMLSNYSPILTTPSGGQNAFDACNDYTLNSYNDWFLPSVEELWFVRNNLPGTINSLLWSSNFFDDFYPDPSVYIENYDGFSTPPSSWDRSRHTALSVDMSTTITKDLSTGTYMIGDTIATENLRYQAIDVRPMRRFTCSNNSSSKRQSFIDKKIKRPEETGPFGILGYYPLYDTTKGAISNSPDSSYHIHEFNGEYYYMPDGLEMGITQFHGDWKPKKPTINIEDFNIGGGVDYVSLDQLQPEEQVIQPEQQRIILPDEPEETPPPVVIPEPEPEPDTEPTYIPPPPTRSRGGEGSSGGY